MSSTNNQEFNRSSEGTDINDPLSEFYELLNTIVGETIVTGDQCLGGNGGFSPTLNNRNPLVVSILQERQMSRLGTHG